MRITEPDAIGIGELKPGIKVLGFCLTFGPALEAMLGWGFDILFDQPVGRIEGGGGTLCNIGDTGASKIALFRLPMPSSNQCHRKRCRRRRYGSHHGQSPSRQGRWSTCLLPIRRSSPRTSPRRSVRSTPFHNLLPALIASPLDSQIARFEAEFVRTPIGCRSQWSSRRPLVLCRNQSTTKLTPMVKIAIAAAGNSGVMSPKVMRLALSLTMLPQSAVGG